MVNFFFLTKHMANDDFSEPPRRTDSKSPIFIFFFADYWVRVTSGARGVSLGRTRQLSLFWLRGGASQGALSTPPPPQIASLLAPVSLSPQTTQRSHATVHTMQTFQAEPHMPSTLDVSKQIDFSVASRVAAPLD